VVCSLETSSQLARLGVNCGLSGDVLTPPRLVSMMKTRDSTFGLLEEDTGFAVSFTTQTSLVVRLERGDRSRTIVGLGNEEDQRKAACSHQLPCFCARCCPCHLALTCCIGLRRCSPRAAHERSNIQMQGAWHSSIEEIQNIRRAHRRLANHRTALQKKSVLTVHAEAIECTARAF
jgi:hypothetical protein